MTDCTRCGLAGGADFTHACAIQPVMVVPNTASGPPIDVPSMMRAGEALIAEAERLDSLRGSSEPSTAVWRRTVSQLASALRRAERVEDHLRTSLACAAGALEVAARGGPLSFAKVAAELAYAALRDHPDATGETGREDGS